MRFQNGGSRCVVLLCEILIGRKIGRYVVHKVSHSASCNASCALVAFHLWTTSRDESFSQFFSLPILRDPKSFVQHIYRQRVF